MKNIAQTDFAGKDISINYLQDKALIALQGPKAHLALQPLVDIDLSKVYFNNHLIVKCPQINSTIQIVRAGYTGWFSMLTI